MAPMWICRTAFAPEDRALLTDPQTSGGLLVSCAPAALGEVLAIFRRHRLRRGRGDRDGGRVERRATLDRQLNRAGPRPPVPGDPPLAREWAYPFTHTTCLSVCTTSTRSRCAAITASMSL